MKDKKGNNQNQQQPLLTPTSVALSLAPPRVPPYGSILRKLYTHPKYAHRYLREGALVGLHLQRSEKNDNATDHHHDELDEGCYQSHTLTSRILQLFGPTQNHYFQSHHPHLPTSLSLPDRLTRFLGVALPLDLQHSLRDGGYFKALADGMVTLTCPLIGAGNWTAVREFLELSDFFSPSLDRSYDVNIRKPHRAAVESHGDRGMPSLDGNEERTKQGQQKRKRRWTKKRIPYGDHPMQYIDLFLPSNKSGHSNVDSRGATATSHPRNNYTSDHITNNKIPVRGTLFFVHGGAWGAGHPWMYRLVAPSFLKLGFAVVIVGYRTYPDAETIDDQCGDVKSAWDMCEGVLDRLVVQLDPGDNEWIGNVVMGHSSGAHVALLMLVDWIEERVKAPSSMTCVNDATRLTNEDIVKKKYKWKPDYFVGLSGPYDISYHFDYEAGRGVEQISPMKPICGYSRDNFHRASPVKRLLSLFRGQREDLMLHQQLTPPILLVHGIEDPVVPFTATSDAGRILRSCGLKRCDEMYLEETSHQDVIMHFMLGGLARDLVFDWLFQGSSAQHELNASQLQSRL